MDYDPELYEKFCNAPHFIDELSCSPEKIFLNLNPKNQNEAMDFLEDIKNKYSKEYGNEIDIIEILQNFEQSLSRLIMEYGNSTESIYLQKYEYYEELDMDDFYYTFLFFKIIEGASNFYIKNCLTYSSDNNSQNNKYEYLSSFCNNSQWNLKKLVSTHIMFEDIDEANKILESRLLEYVRNFNIHFQKILKGFKFFSIIDFLRENNLLLNFIVGLYAVELNEGIFKDLKNFKKCCHLFINVDPFIPQSTISGEYLDKSILPSLLFSNIDLENKSQISIYDPACTEGILLLDCLMYVKEINPNCEVNLYGCCTDSRHNALCLSKMLFNYQDLNNFYLVEKENLQNSLNIIKDNRFDFMISNFENQKELSSSSFYNIYDEFPIIFEKFNERLLFVCSFKELNGGNEINDFIEKDLLESIIHLPSSLNSGNDGILILNRCKDNKRKNKFLLIDEFDKNNIYDSNEIPKKVIKNIFKYYPKFKNYKNGKIFSISQIKEDSEFFNRIFFKFQGFMYDKNRETIKTDAPIYPFHDLIVKEIYRDVHNSSYDLLIPINMFYTHYDKIAYYEASEEMGLFYHIPLKPIILKEYLYYYLNSNKAKADLSYLTLGFRDMGGIFYLPIPVPSIDEQKRIIDAARKMDGFFNAMDMWRNNYSNNILNYKNTLKSYDEFTCAVELSENGSIEMCPRWKIVYQGLIWPLATTYLTATRGSNNKDIRKRNHIILFEFIASFNVITLISAVVNSAENIEDYDKLMKNDLWTLMVNGKDKSGNKIFNYKSWHRMSFGSWTKLYSNLNKIFKKHKFNTPMDRKFFENLSSKKYDNLFNKLREKERNTDFHGGFDDDFKVSIKLQELQRYLDEDIFDILKTYSGLKLYYTTGDCCPISPKKTEYTVMSLNGPCNPPNPSKIKTDIKLEPKSLYLYDPLNNDFLKLYDDLIKFRLIPGTKEYGIYIYDGIDIKENVALYKCYYEDERWKIPLKTDEDTFLKVSDEFLKYALRINK